MNNPIIKEIEKLKKENNAVILAHYYVDEQIQEIADYVGDSFYLSKVALNCKADTIVFAGVKFMGESAKLLNPDKTVLMPDIKADCPMAHMADEDNIKRLKKQYDDLYVVTYVNSTAKLKALSDVCVTSSNALEIVSQLESKHILFIPDQNLGRYIASKLPDKEFILGEGYCPVHHDITLEELEKAKEKHPQALVLTHPECQMNILKNSDYIGSTAQLIDYARNSKNQEFIIVTEMGVLYQLEKENPDKKFYLVNDYQICPGMKQNSLEKIRDCLKDHKNEIILDDKDMEKANLPLIKMQDMAR